MALDLLERMLVFNPNKRISVQQARARCRTPRLQPRNYLAFLVTLPQALEHPYLATLHDPSVGINAQRSTTSYLFEASNSKLTHSAPGGAGGACAICV